MLSFPNAKINLGLHVISRRNDGYHNIETVFYPVNWCDALEIVKGNESGAPIQLTISGFEVTGQPEDNLVYNAYMLLREKTELPPLSVFLHKHIPMGAGLGGGSSDAALFINEVCSHYIPTLHPDSKIEIASRLGSDCAFFIRNNPVYATGTGNIFSPVNVNLDAWYILIVYPGVNSNTRDAYSGLTPRAPGGDLREILSSDIRHWKERLVNDFEATIFSKFPVVGELKKKLYDQGAVYACMSGSGSSVFGIFSQEPDTSWIISGYTFHVQKARRG